MVPNSHTGNRRNFVKTETDTNWWGPPEGSPFTISTCDQYNNSGGFHISNPTPRCTIYYAGPLLEGGLRGLAPLPPMEFRGSE